MITLTTKAIQAVKKLLEDRKKDSEGIRIGVKTKGCSGLSYTLEYVDTKDNSDEKIVVDDVNVFIDPKASLFLIGTKMDYVEDDLQSGFQFSNPNEKGRCGCGESFHV
ncbi:MAG: Fe-S cluster assembly scaffold SufA [Rickettsiales bacterium]|jgi:iron-sulfur cluster assembly protein|nr:Fe-S cluster assembly scaffold SufA [Rickettsiales bacterium]OUV52906.1 MAG: Fe-S cluster assembly scaffold SufA [Rickettsiales bacterium TMED127]|tara:strand:- start:5457 stop:5780 length:324 start_codon:yes stop_codon:yes gene_type:complete